MMPPALHALATFFALPAVVSWFYLFARPNLPEHMWMAIFAAIVLLWGSAYLQKGDTREVIKASTMLAVAVWGLLYLILDIRVSNIEIRMKSSQLALDLRESVMLYTAGICTFSWVMIRTVGIMWERQIRRRPDIVQIEQYRKKKAAGNKWCQ